MCELHRVSNSSHEWRHTRGPRPTFWRLTPLNFDLVCRQMPGGWYRRKPVLRIPEFAAPKRTSWPSLERRLPTRYASATMSKIVGELEMVERGGGDKASVRTSAVFISYASQDAEAAGRICEALRAAGIEIWFDQSELRGGEAWDQSIHNSHHWPRGA